MLIITREQVLKFTKDLLTHDDSMYINNIHVSKPASSSMYEVRAKHYHTRRWRLVLRSPIVTFDDAEPCTPKPGYTEAYTGSPLLLDTATRVPASLTLEHLVQWTGNTLRLVPRTPYTPRSFGYLILTPQGTYTCTWVLGNASEVYPFSYCVTELPVP